MENNRRCEVVFHNLYLEKNRFHYMQSMLEEIEGIVVWNLHMQVPMVNVWLHKACSSLEKRKIQNEVDCFVATFLKYQSHEEAYTRLQIYLTHKQTVHTTHYRDTQIEGLVCIGFKKGAVLASEKTMQLQEYAKMMLHKENEIWKFTYPASIIDEKNRIIL